MYAIRSYYVKDWKAFRQIRSVLKEIKPDIVTCHSSKAGLLGRLAARSLGIPVIFTAHGWAFTDGVPTLSVITSYSIHYTKLYDSICAVLDRETTRHKKWEEEVSC